jgi:hypothetical protein
MYSPDPAYADKLTHLLSCLHEVALYPSEVVLLFMDEMGFYRWPDPGTDWMLLLRSQLRLLPAQTTTVTGASSVS